MAKKRLTSENAKIVRITEGTELTGNGTDTIDVLAGGSIGDGTGEGYYLVSAIGNSSALPANLEVKMVFWDEGSLVPATGDKIIPMDVAKMSDVQGFTFEFAVDEIETTTLDDELKVYSLGKTDLTGSIEGVFELGTTEASGGIMNKFVRVVKQAAAGTVTVSDVDNQPIFVMAFINKTETSNDTEGFFFAQMQLLGANLGATGSDKQAWSSNVRLAPSEYIPTLYFRELA